MIPDIRQEALQDSVQKHWPYTVGGQFYTSSSARTDVLQPHGSRLREWQLRQLWYNDYNTTFKGGIKGLIKRVQSTPYSVKTDRDDANYWQDLLMTADFSDWDTFLSKLILDYSRQDQGAFIELIAPGDPMLPPTSAITGLAILDSLRCYPTGDPTYPVIYYDIKGGMHVLHYSRVIQFVDTPDSDETIIGYGTCALSNCLAPVWREVLMNRYIEIALDDKPTPGMLIFRNLDDKAVQNAIQKMHEKRLTDTGGEWGRTLQLFGLTTEHPVDVQSVSFNTAPEKFDFVTYKEITVKEMALGIGVDIQDLWELSGGNIGSGTQSAILAQKSRGKALGRILKTLERVLNQALPEHVRFEWKYEDPQADSEQAAIASQWAGVVQLLSTDLSMEERRRLLADKVPGLREVISDPEGRIQERFDADPVAPDQEEQIADDTIEVEAAKDFRRTATRFERDMRSLLEGEFSPAQFRSQFRALLLKSGRSAYNDGLEDAGIDLGQETASENRRRQKVVNEWLITQNPFIGELSTRIAKGGTAQPDLWVHKSLSAIYQLGLLEGDKAGWYQWKLGQTEESCETCLALNGQIHRLATYSKAGKLPRSKSLACKGFNCDCRLEKVKANAPTGRIPGYAGPEVDPAKPVSGIVGSISNFIQRIVGVSN